MADNLSIVQRVKFYEFGSNTHWQPGEPVGAPVSTFHQIQYLPLPYAMPDLDQTLSVARLDCGQDLHKQLIEFGGAAKVWMTVLFEYESVNPLANISSLLNSI